MVSSAQRGAFPTIGEAHQAIDAEGVIAIAPGEYSEILAVRGRKVTFLAAEGPGTVVIDSSPSQGAPS